MDSSQVTMQIERDVREASEGPLRASSKWGTPLLNRLVGGHALLVAGVCAAGCAGALLHAFLVPGGRRHKLYLMRKFVRAQLHLDNDADPANLQSCLRQVFDAYDDGAEDCVGTAGDHRLCRGEAMLFFQDYFKTLSDEPFFQEEMMKDVEEMIREKGTSSLSGEDFMLFFKAEEDGGPSQATTRAELTQSVAAHADRDAARRLFFQRVFSKKRYNFTERWFKFCDADKTGDLSVEEMEKALIGDRLADFQSLTAVSLTEALGYGSATPTVEKLLSREPTVLVEEGMPRSGSTGRLGSATYHTPFGTIATQTSM